MYCACIQCIVYTPSNSPPVPFLVRGLSGRSNLSLLSMTEGALSCAWITDWTVKSCFAIEVAKIVALKKPARCSCQSNQPGKSIAEDKCPACNGKCTNKRTEAAKIGTCAYLANERQHC